MKSVHIVEIMFMVQYEVISMGEIESDMGKCDDRWCRRMQKK